MFKVTVKDEFTIAHSLKGNIFGPAQRLHGAVYLVEVTVAGDSLDDNGVLIDIGTLVKLVKRVLTPLDYQNLDNMEAFHGINTTTEVLARHICKQIISQLNSPTVKSVEVTLHESRSASASYGESTL